MARTRVSSRYQVVIPKEVRESAGIHVGQEFQVIAKDHAELLTTDSGFDGLASVTVFSKKR